MRKLICTLWLFVSLLVTAYSQNIPGPKLVVRGDDMGATHAINQAILFSAKNGIQTSIELMVTLPWFPEAVKFLRENPGYDVGIHLDLNSEWDLYKPRPLTNCPSLTDANGYFYPYVNPDKKFPGQAIKEHEWKLDEIEKEFRAQIELGLKNVPQVSHLSSHMGVTAMDKKVAELTYRLAAEYNLPDINTDPLASYNIIEIGYAGPKKTLEEKMTSFTKMLESLEPGKTYMFVDHPAYDTEEMRPISYKGVADVAVSRQGVTDLWSSDKIKKVIADKGIQLVTFNEITKALPRSLPETEGVSSKGITSYLDAVKKSGQELHSVMILRHGKVVSENWFGDNAANKTHVMYSVSKTFTSTAVGFAVTEKLISINDKVIKFFPADLPDTVSANLAELTVKDLLTMSVGHEVDPTNEIRSKDGSWEKMFLAKPVKYKPGTKFVYNSLATYMLSAIVQKVTGETLMDYLYPRLFRPLGITGIDWDKSPTGVNTGGWGLWLKTEDMAKLGQFYLQKGNWNGKQLLPEAWIDEATSAKITQPATWVNAGTKPKDSDYLQGYCYQMWRCRNNAFRADGAKGQLIIVMPEKDAVVVITANTNPTQPELDLVWKYLLPAMK
jgi:CubicO group peptidase (beta-lactamase class C family)/predicted glycoside hydrolase/deacetylase ChbG (UPF0249 family)